MANDKGTLRICEQGHSYYKVIAQPVRRAKLNVNRQKDF